MAGDTPAWSTDVEAAISVRGILHMAVSGDVCAASARLTTGVSIEDITKARWRYLSMIEARDIT